MLVIVMKRIDLHAIRYVFPPILTKSLLLEIRLTTFRNWVILSNWALWPRLWTPLELVVVGESQGGSPWLIFLMYPYFVEAILLQWISGYSSGLHCISSEIFVFIWTYLTYFLPFSCLKALSWVQIEFFINFCTIVQYPRAYFGQVSTE